MENLRPKKLYSTARRIFCCKKPKKTLDDYRDKAWRRPSSWDIDEDNVEPICAKTEYIEPFQIKGYACEALLTDHSLLTCAGVRYELEGTCIKRYGKCQYYSLAAPNGGVDTVYNHFPECYSHARIILEMLLRFSRQRPIALMDIYLLNDEEAERIAEEWDKIDPYFPKIPVKKLIMGNKNFGMERFFDFEYLSLRRGAQLYPEINTAKFLVVSDKQDDPEEIKRFKGWGLVGMEAEENQFPPTILKDRVTEWLETGNCQYKFLCIFDENRDIIEDSIIKWALSLKGEPVPENFGEMANLKKRLIHGEEEGIIYIFKRNCIVFMRGDAICDEFGHLLALGGPRSKNLFRLFYSFLSHKSIANNHWIRPYHVEMAWESQVHASSKFPEEQFSQVRLLLKLLLRFSQQKTIARMQFFSFETDEKQREFLLQRIAEFDEVAALNLPKIPVKKLLLSGCDRNFGFERFFDFEYLALYRGTQLYPELNTAKFLVVSDKQEDPEEIKKFLGWGLAVMEAEQNHFSPEILKDQVTEWLETGNCQYKFLCILDEKQDIIEDSIIKWALSLKGEPVQRSCGNDNANLKKRMIHDEEEGILYIFERNCIVFMRGGAICDDFAQLAEFGAPYPGSHMFFGPKDAFQKIVPFTEEMFS